MSVLKFEHNNKNIIMLGKSSSEQMALLTGLKILLDKSATKFSEINIHHRSWITVDHRERWFPESGFIQLLSRYSNENVGMWILGSRLHYRQ